MDNIIGNRLKQLRIEHQLTMEMMCEDFNYRFNQNLNTSQISRWENGKVDPGLSTGRLLAKYYNVSLDYIIGLTDIKTPSRLLAYARKMQNAISESPKRNAYNIPVKSISDGPLSYDIDDELEREFLDLDD